VRVFETFKGKKAEGLRYKPLFTFLLPEKASLFRPAEEFVNTEDGTGLVHIAPAYGQEDMQAALEHDLPVLRLWPKTAPSSQKYVPGAASLSKTPTH
jgi:isoleucyl-tRNA synthetase